MPPPIKGSSSGDVSFQKQVDAHSSVSSNKFLARIKNALGIKTSARAKNLDVPSDPSTQSLAKRDLSTGKAPVARAKQEPLPAKFAPQTQRLTQFLSQQALSESWNKAHAWHPALSQHLLAALREPTLHAELGYKNVEDPAKLLEHLIQLTVDSAPADKAEEIRTRLSVIGEAGEFKEAHAIALKQLGDAKTQILTQHANAEFEAPVLKNDLTLADLPSEITDSKEFKAFTQLAASTVLEAKGKISDDQVKTLGKAFNSVLNLEHKDPQGKSRPVLSDTAKFALTLSDGKAFMESLAQAVRKEAPLTKGGTLARQLTELQANGTLGKIYNQGASGLGDRQASSGSIDTLILGGQNYKQQQMIGSGNFGQIYIYKKDPSVPGDPGVVVKVPTGGDVEALINGPALEGRNLVNALGSGANENIVPLKGAVRTDDGLLLLVLPLAQHGSLEGAMKDLKFDVANGKIGATTAANAILTPLLDLARGIERMQLAKGQLHFDIAARNVLITGKGVGQLADFGLTEQLQGAPADAKSEITTDKIPVRWSAPERLNQKDANAAPVTTKADTWMFGMTLYELVYGGVPFPNKSNAEAAAIIRNFDPTNPEHLPPIDTTRWPSPMDQKLRALLIDILKSDPSQRLSMDEVQRRFARDFPDVGSAASREWLHLSLTQKIPNELMRLSNSIANQVAQSADTWPQSMLNIMKAALNDPALANKEMRAILADPEKSLDFIVKGAVDNAPLAQKETVRAALRDPKFIKAFTTATLTALKTAPQLPPPPLIVPMMQPPLANPLPVSLVSNPPPPSSTGNSDEEPLYSTV